MLFQELGNAVTDDGFIALSEALIAGSLPELVYLNVDSMVAGYYSSIDNQLTAVAMEALKKVVESKACPKLQAVSLNCFSFVLCFTCSK